MKNTWNFVLLAGFHLSLSHPLGAQTTTVPAPVLLDFQVPSQPVDVGSGEGLIYVEAKFTSETDLIRVTGSFASPDGNQSIPFSNSDYPLAYHTTGSPRAGTVRIPVYIPSQLPSGAWTGSISLVSTAGSRRYGGSGGKDFPSGSLPKLNLVNNGPVNTPPVWTSLVTDRQSVDVTDSPQTLTLTVEIEDDQALERLSLSFSKADGGYYETYPLEPAQRIAGNSQKGTYQLRVTLPRSIAPGDYTISCSAYEPGQAQTVSLPTPAGCASNTITVVNRGEVDTKPPTLVAFHLNKTAINVTDEAQTVEATIVLEDSMSGLRNAYLSVIEKSEEESLSIAGTTFIYDPPATYETGRATYAVRITIPRHSSAGIARFTLSLTDGAENSVTYDNATETPFPAGSDSSLQIGNNLPPATGKPPVLTSFSFSPSSMDKAGLPALMEFQVRLKSAIAITSVTPYVVVSPRVSRGTPLALVEGTPLDGNWVGRSAMREGPGEYFMWLSVKDESGKSYEFGVTPGLFQAAVSYPAGWPAPLLISPGGQALDSYQTWRKAFTGFEGPDGAEQADPDGDGFPNAVEFLCNTDPRRSTLPGGADPGSKRLFWNPAALRMEYTPEPLALENAALGSGTRLRLKAWKSSTLKPGSWQPVEAVAGDGSSRLYPLDPPGTAGSAQFLRLGAGEE